MSSPDNPIRTPSRWRRRRLIGLALLVTATMAGIWLFFPFSGLPAPARSVLTRPYWRLGSVGHNVRQNILPPHPWAETYLWLNDREILAFDSTDLQNTRRS